MEVITRNEEEVIVFDKWEGMSVIQFYDNDPEGETDAETEEYVLEEEYYNGDKDITDYLSTLDKNKFYLVHNYRWLEYGENTYYAGETYTTLYFVNSEGEVTEEE